MSDFPGWQAPDDPRRGDSPTPGRPPPDSRLPHPPPRYSHPQFLAPAYQQPQYQQSQHQQPQYSQRSTTPLDVLRAQARRRRILVALAVAFALFAGGGIIVVAGYRDQQALRAGAGTTATTAPPPASFSASAGEIAFSYDGSEGVFALNSHEWEGSTLVANVTIEVTEGGMGFKLGGWGAAGDGVYAEETGAPEPVLDAEYVEAGDSATGNVVLEFEERGAATLTLGDTYGDSIAALPVT